MKNIKFSYGDLQVLDDVSFDINKGEVVALVGASGSGKTTLSNLLLRLVEPSSGSIDINGVCLSSLDLNSWRSSLGVVTQDATLFNDTIYNNICLTDPSPDKEGGRKRRDCSSP